MSATRGRRPPMGAIRQELASLGRRPRKRLGQHFLADSGVARRIVDLAALGGTERVVEIGPGLGALSELLVSRARELWLIEVDADLAERLRAAYAAQPQVHVIHADVLGIDFAALLGAGEPAVVVANLPYNIATAVLTALLAQHRCFTRMVLMLQREVVERLRAQPGSKTYGALSVFTQFAARLRPGMRVGAAAFVPRPKVESEVIIVEPFDRPPVDVADAAAFARVVRTAFNQRRKQLLNSLRPLCPDPSAVLRAARIDPTRRPETLSLAEFAALSDALKQTTDCQTTDNRLETSDVQR
ncbi:MAG TPA: 16S rRNA (adenine(1518)-N(6)/adenine(1519)-N(6))-dimethyltransferase RsmA [Candidatus Acidoferrales bacterium]|nr:16S rRNA (adenine(1518)-N(6)/adenine(1519)-N(6))-dimethyltransferase RsmA [Candidatus Acidoferrales bacterium]